MQERIIHHAVEAIEEEGIMQALEIIDDNIAEPCRETAKENMVHTALDQRRFHEETLRDFILRRATYRVPRSDDPEINRDIIREAVARHYRRKQP